MKEMLIEIQNRNAIQDDVDTELAADVHRALQLLELSVGVRVLNNFSVTKLTTFRVSIGSALFALSNFLSFQFLWSIVMFFILVKSESKY